MGNQKGFSMMELVVSVATIGILVLATSSYLNTVKESRMIACTADLHTMETMVEQVYEQSRPWIPTWEAVQGLAGARWKDHYHYLPNNTDLNKGHGNDLDLCDEENPGKSLQNRNCLDIQWVIVCDHDHGELGKYNFALALDTVYSVASNATKNWKKPYVPAEPAFLHELTWWEQPDPQLQKWIGR